MEEIVAIFVEGLGEKELQRYETGDWCGVNLEFTPRGEEKKKYF